MLPRLRPRAQQEEALGRCTLAEPRGGASLRARASRRAERRVQAPIAEEFAFRACMVPLLLDAGYSEAAVVFGCPLFFGKY
jgi:hypothetical protein